MEAVLRAGGGHMPVSQTLYLSGPMTGIEDFNYPAFHAAEARWAGAFQVLNPARCFGGEQGLPYEQYMRAAVEMLLQADTVAFLPGWERSVGARFEHDIATKLKLTLMTVDGFPLESSTSKPTNPKQAIGSTKVPLHLWPMTATAWGSLGLLDGALKYGRANWRVAGVRASIYYDALTRHVTKWFEGQDTDPDSGLPHLAHALACLAIVVDAQAAGVLNDDRQVKGGVLEMMDRLSEHVTRLQEKYADRHPHHYTIQDNAV